MPDLKRPMSMTNKIQIKMNRIKQDKDMPLYYLKVGDLRYEYENMQIFHIRHKIEGKHTSHKDVVE